MIRGQYQLLEKIGAGGMGEVYRAKDTKLNRLVAVKILRGDMAVDQARQRRFIQEAQAASALNHPNIITIYDIVTENGSEIMIMEYVAGKTLEHIIPRGGLRLPAVLAYAQQMADALKTAHTAGIVHRDLKPANVMVTTEERVKILDFGLAKLNFGSDISPGEDPEATQLAPLTVAGTIMGTICYMSPEQAQGKPVDARSDIFSFGAVLYEMATGERAFAGDNMATMLSAVLRDEPRRIMELSPSMPTELDEVIRLCLTKNKEDRWKSMDVVHQVLTRLKHVSDSGQLFQSQVAGANPSAANSSSGASKLPSGAGPVAAQSAPTMMMSGSSPAFQPPPNTPLSTSTFVGAVPPPVTPKKLKLSKKGWWLVGALAVGAATCWNGERNVRVSTSDPIVDINLSSDDSGDMDNNKVIKLVKAKASAALIISQIRNAGETNFDLSTDEVLKLVKAGVSEEVIEVMRNPKSVPPQSTSQSPQQSTVAETNKPTVSPTSSVSTPNGDKSSPASPTVPPVPAHKDAKSTPAGLTVVTLPDGLPMQLSLDSDVPLTAEDGLKLNFVVSEEVKVNDVIVIGKGASAAGEIVVERRRGAKIFGGGQRLSFRLKEVLGVDGKKLSIRNTPSQRATESPLRPLDAMNRKGLKKDLAAMKDSPFLGYIAGEQSVQVKR